MMKAGTYWVGDLCYVLDKRWDEVCDLTIDGSECLDGEFELNDGIKFATESTLYGDGSYPDGFDRFYDVDSGTIGCVLLSNIDGASSGGHVVEFKEDFFLENINGEIRFVAGSGECLLAIQTGEIEYEDEDWFIDDEDEN